MEQESRFHFDAIGIVHSPYREKFAIPRQPGLVGSAEATLELLPPYNRAEAVRGLEAFSHIWVTFVFHGVRRQEWRPTVRPPRLGGNERIGVFATRSTHRPNPIGLSAVELVGIECCDGKVLLRLRGADLLDGTPVLDIKPYIPYSDSLPQARAGFAQEPPDAVLSVQFSEQAESFLHQNHGRYPQLRALLVELLALDPRPAYQQQETRTYGFQLYDLDVRFHIEGAIAIVEGFQPL